MSKTFVLEEYGSVEVESILLGSEVFDTGLRISSNLIGTIIITEPHDLETLTPNKLLKLIENVLFEHDL